MTQVIHNYDIRTPIWNGSAKKRMIGIATSRLKNCDELHVQITQTNKHNERIYPDTYVFTKPWFESYEGEIVSRHGVTLKYFFIDDLIPNDNTFLKEASKYGQFTQHTITNNKKIGVVNGKSNTCNNKYKPTRTKI
tara:strand:- start:745 stop:1152 length:408 start_codon:yes stop_codon:yes gene_type:complete